MKRITTFLFLFSLMNNYYSFSQTVTIDAITINNISISNGTAINLGASSTSTITFNTKVALLAAPSDSNPGSIDIYYQKSSSTSPISPTGGKGGNLLFSGSTSASRTFNISLESSSFDPSGGFLYAEYKTYSGIKYKSTNISIVKSSNGNGGGTPADAPNPANIANTLCCNQTVRLGDKPAPITGSQYANPYENYSYGINSSWSVNNPLPFTVDNVNKTLNFDYTTELKNITVTRSLGYNSSTNPTNKSNTVTITVVPSPIISNIISTTLPPNSDGFCEFSISKGIYINGDNSMINLNILQDPFYPNKPYYSNTPVDKYHWEFAVLKNNNLNSPIKEWTIIDNETSFALTNFNPSVYSSTEDKYFLIRRIATYQNISSTSNELKVMTRGVGYNNTICCDQTLKITSSTTIENPSTLTGSIPEYSNPDLDPNNSYYTISYQWQSQTVGRSTGVWTDIIGANSKDYLPLPLKVINDSRGGRGNFTVESSYNYRRIAKIAYTGFINGVWSTDSKLSYSNEIFLTGSTESIPSLIVYPNPATSIINIENKKGDIFFNITSKSVSIRNTNGTIVNSNNYSIISPTLISINISNLPLGIYYVCFDTGDRRTSQIAFIKQ